MGALEVKEPMRDAGRVEGQVEALHLAVIEIRKARQAEVGGGLKIGRPDAGDKAGPATDDPGDRAAYDAGRRRPRGRRPRSPSCRRGVRRWEISSRRRPTRPAPRARCPSGAVP